MGCTCTLRKESQDTTAEEVVGMYEGELGWRACNVSVLLHELDRADHRFLSSREFYDLLSCVSARTPNFRDLHSPLTSLYSCLKADRRYSSSKVCLFSVLLTACEAERKLELLETAYCVGEKEVDVHTAIEDLCEIALVFLPMYTYLELEFVHDLSSVAKLTKYMEKLRRKKGDALRQLKSGFGSFGSMSRPQFRAVFMSREMNCVFSAAALRAFCASLPASSSPQKVSSILKPPSTAPSPNPSRSVRFLPHSQAVIID